MRMISFDGYDLPQARHKQSFPLTLDSPLVSVPGTAGGFDVWGDATVRQPVTVTHSGLIYGTAATIDTALDALRKKTNSRGWLVFETRAGTERGTWAKLLSVSFSDELENVNHLPVELTFQIADPWLVATAQGWYFDSGSTFDSGLLMGANYSTRTGTGDLTITNSGGGPITRGQITVAGSGSTVAIENAANGWSIDYGATLAIGETLFINIGAQTATIDGISVWDDITIGSTQTGLMRLELGANVLTITGGGVFTYYWTEVY